MKKYSAADLRSTREDGTITDDWIMNELLGDDDLDDPYARDISQEPDDESTNLAGTSEGAVKAWDSRGRKHGLTEAEANELDENEGTDGDARVALHYVEFSGEINGALREGKPLTGENKRIADKLQGAIESSPVTEPFVVVYRSMPASVVAGLKDGKTFVDPAFVSASKHHAIHEILVQDAGVLEEDYVTVGITVPKGVGMLDVNKELGRHAQYPHQREVILGRNTKFKVRRNGNRVTLNVKTS